MEEEKITATTEKAYTENSNDCVYVNYEKEAQKGGKRKTALLAVTILCVVAVAFFLVYITRPANSAMLHKAVADTYYAKGEFDKARVEYDKAISIDAYALNVYKGLLLCDFALGNNFAADDFSMVRKAFTEAYASEIIPEGYEANLCETYLLAPEIYTQDYETLIEVLAEGCNCMPGNTGLKTALSDSYYLRAGQCALEGDFKRAAECYEQVDALRNTSGCFEAAKEAVIGNINSLMAENLYEEAYNYALMKGNYFGEELGAYAKDIARHGLSHASGNAALTKAYDVLKDIYEEYRQSLDYSTNKDVNTANIRLFTENFDDMLLIDGSTDADLCAYSFLKDKYLMTPSGNAVNDDYFGTALGIYTYGDKYTDENGKETIGYYFFIGNYENGKREGYGISYAALSQTSYIMFEGYYKDDSPNGYGILYCNERFDYTLISRVKTVMAGILKDGCFDGTVQAAVYLNDFPAENFSGEFTAKNGVPDTIADSTLFYSITRDAGDERPLYAVLTSDLYGYASFVPMYHNEPARLGALGYDF